MAVAAIPMVFYFRSASLSPSCCAASTVLRHALVSLDCLYTAIPRETMLVLHTSRPDVVLRLGTEHLEGELESWRKIDFVCLVVSYANYI